MSETISKPRQRLQPFRRLFAYIGLRTHIFRYRKGGTVRVCRHCGEVQLWNGSYWWPKDFVNSAGRCIPWTKLIYLRLKRRPSSQPILPDTDPTPPSSIASADRSVRRRR